MKRVLFVLPNVSRNAAEQGQALSVEDVQALETIAGHAGVQADVVLATQERETWGHQTLPWKAMKAERERLLREINASDVDFVMVFGTKAARAIVNKGSGFKLADLTNHEHHFDDINKPVWFTHSLEELAAKSGLIKWMGLELLKAAHGDQPVQWGDYLVSTEPVPELLQYVGRPDPTTSDGTPTVTVDLETFPGISPYDKSARIRMLVISHRSGWAQVVQCTPDSGLPDWVVSILEDDRIRKVGSNIRFDVRWLRRFGYEVNNVEDLPHLQHLLDENCGVKDLKTLTLRYHPTLGDYSEGNRKLVEERGGWEGLKDEEMYQYAGGDGDAGITIWRKMDRDIADAGLQVPRRIQSRIYEAFTEMELNGACVSLEENERLNDAYSEELSRLSRDIRGDLGRDINLNSPLQLAQALQYAVPDINLRKVFVRKEDEDTASTARAVLQREARKHPVLRKILEYRSKSTLHRFVTALPKHVQMIGGRAMVFTRLRGDVTVTHRQSSSQPSMQNIPSNAATDGLTAAEAMLAAVLNVKNQYVSRFPGGSIAEYDASQAELRETAMIAQDQALMDAFLSGRDVHTELASMMLGVPIDMVTEDMRSDCKTTNFRVLYGGEAWGLSLSLGCSKQRAQDLIDKFFGTFHGYADWRDENAAFVKKHLYVESRFGFRRRFIRPVSWTSKSAKHILRQSANQPIQNGSGITCGIGMAQAIEEMLARRMRSVPFLMVHDSLAVDRYPGEEAEVDEIVFRNMEHPNTIQYGVDLSLPMVADGKAGRSWGEAEKILR